MSAEQLTELNLAVNGQPLKEREDPWRPGQQRQQTQQPPAGSPPPTRQSRPKENKEPVVPPLVKARDALKRAIQAARQAKITDIHVLGPLENGFEDAKNAVADKDNSAEALDKAAKALELGANALANHSGTSPEDLKFVREMALATKHAAEAPQKK